MIIALVLGGALNADGELCKYVQNRCSQAVTCDQKFDYYIASSRYTLNVPPKLKQNGHIIYENKKISDYLKYLGVSNDQIIMESASTDTIGSALFSRIYIQNLFSDYPNFLEISLVTSKFHMQRACEIFSWAFSLKPCTLKFKINCLNAHDFDISDERESREINSLRRFQSEWKQLTKLQDAFTKLLTYHDNYSTAQNSTIINNNKNLNY